MRDIRIVSRRLKIWSADGAPRAQWLRLATLSFTSFLIIGCTLSALSIYLPFLKPFADAQHRPPGSAATAMLLAMSIGNLPVGWACDRFGFRSVMVTGVLCVAAGCCWASQASTMDSLVMAMALTGAGVAGSTVVPGVAIIMQHWPGNKALALAIFLGMDIFAGAALPPLINLILLAMGWAHAFLVSGIAIGMVCLPMMLAAVPARTGIREGHPAAGERLGGLADIVARAAYRRFALATTLIQFAINGAMFACISCLMAQGFTQIQAVNAYSIANFLGLPALFCGGLLARRFGAPNIFVGIVVILAAGTVALLPDPRWGAWGLSPFILLWGASSGMIGQVSSLYLAQIVEPRLFARTLGANTMIISLVGSLAPLCTDWLTGEEGGYVLPISLYAAMALAAALLIASKSRPSPTS